MQGSEVPILEYYNTVFVEIMRDWNLSPLPAMNRSILANIFVANLDEFLLATLVETYGHLIEAKNMYKWHLEEILRACMTLESSPRYQADKQMRKVLMENDLLTTQSTNKQVVSAVEVGSAPQTMEQIRRSDGKTWATNGMYRDMTVEQRGKFDEHCRKIRALDKPHVLGANGQFDYFLRDGKATETKPACALIPGHLPNARACDEVGHFPGNCPLNRTGNNKGVHFGGTHKQTTLVSAVLADKTNVGLQKLVEDQKSQMERMGNMVEMLVKKVADTEEETAKFGITWEDGEFNGNSEWTMSTLPNKIQI